MLMLFCKIYYLYIKKEKIQRKTNKILMLKYYNIQYSKFRIQIKRIQIIENIQDYSNFGQNFKKYLLLIT